MKMTTRGILTCIAFVSAIAQSANSLSEVVEPRPDGKGDVTISGDLKQWHKVTLTLDGPFAHERDSQPNPFTDLAFPDRHTHLLRSTDLGKTWTHLAHVGLGGEPAVVHLSDSEWLAVTRPDAHMSNFLQHRSLDGGQTWKFERTLEEGSVMPTSCS